MNIRPDIRARKPLLRARRKQAHNQLRQGGTSDCCRGREIDRVKSSGDEKRVSLVKTFSPEFSCRAPLAPIRWWPFAGDRNEGYPTAMYACVLYRGRMNEVRKSHFSVVIACSLCVFLYARNELLSKSALDLCGLSRLFFQPPS